MPNIKVINRDGDETTIPAETGASLMEILTDQGYDIEAICGGMCSCATCHVIIDPNWFGKLEPRHPEETELLSELDSFCETSRLSCQVRFEEKLSGLVLTIAPEE
ncbi:2Fe-2S iron-sulfur cluster-binding protein [Emcibacter sp.]|uniref:2Fe-2S iron-sulfur cluster-binding protein n=1 Tax=Emcibacter sp. TaxID=1979954 RepID=UPI002AA7744C|nr:2Fe-2S iron-sulfur cluster-binding protein [Emcibacter sp.]